MPKRAMVRTGRVKFSKVAFSAAAVAVPLNQRSPTAEEAKRVMKTTPETYSGVAVVAIETVESERSSRDPSRIPASTPTRSAAGTIRSMTQAMSLAVRPRRVATISATSPRNTVEVPQSPWRIPQKRGAIAAASGATRPARQRPASWRSAVSARQPGRTPSHWPYFTGSGRR